MTVRRLRLFAFLSLLALIAASVGTTSWLLAAQRADALLINLAGRQRMLIRQMTLEVVGIRAGIGASHTLEVHEASEAVFTATLTALLYGGEAPYLDGATVNLPPSRDEASIALLLAAQAGKEDFDAAIHRALEAPPQSPEFLEALAEVERLSPILVRQADDLVRRYEALATRKVGRVQGTQMVFFALAAMTVTGAIGITQRAVDDPIRRLTEAAGRIGDGDLETPVPVTGLVETQRLGSAFDRMRRDLQASLDSVRRSEARFRSLVDQAADGIFLFDPGEGCIEVNPSGCAMLGYSREELLGASPTDSPAAQCLTAVPLDSDRFRAGHSVLVEWELRRKDGSRLMVEINARAAPGGHVQGIVRDITARKRRERVMQAVSTVASALRIARSRAEMLPVILDEVLDLLEAEAVALATQVPGSGEVLVEGVRGALEGLLGLRLEPGQGVTGWVIATGQPYRSDDVRSDPLFAHPDSVGDFRAVACVPLITEDLAFGALWVLRRTPIHDGDMRVLTAIAEMAANAIHRATLHEQTERRLHHLTALRSIDMAITGSMDLRVTLGVVLDQALAQLGVDAAGVLLLDAHGRMMEHVAGRGFRGGGITRARVRLGEGYAGRAALERRIVHVSGRGDFEREFARLGAVAAEGFEAYFGVPLVAKGQVKGVLELFHRGPLAPDPEWLDVLEAFAGQAAIAVDNAGLFDQLQRSNHELSLAYEATLEGWVRALDLRDRETEGHTQRVTALAVEMARAMGVPESDLLHVRQGSLLHDIGKMAIPDSILLKPGPLTDEEWAVMRRHPQLALDLLAPIEFLRPALDIPYAHHERWDGAGYPRGLSGEAIPLAARVFALADVWDALTSDRPYRRAWPAEQALEYVREQAGKHFDARVVEAFLAMRAGGSAP